MLAVRARRDGVATSAAAPLPYHCNSRLLLLLLLRCCVLDLVSRSNRLCSSFNPVCLHLCTLGLHRCLRRVRVGVSYRASVRCAQRDTCKHTAAQHPSIKVRQKNQKASRTNRKPFLGAKRWARKHPKHPCSICLVVGCLVQNVVSSQCCQARGAQRAGSAGVATKARPVGEAQGLW